MNAAVMRPLESVRRLEAAGVERGRANAIVGVVVVAVTASCGALATKADIAGLREEIAEFRAEIAAAVNKIIMAQIMVQIAVADVLLAAMIVLKPF